MISYRATKKLTQQQLLGLYEDAGWTAYTKDIEQLQQAVQHSLSVITAWKEDELVGLIRVVGDGLTIIYIQDILVKKVVQNQGIGFELMQQILHEGPFYNRGKWKRLFQLECQQRKTGYEVLRGHP